MKSLRQLLRQPAKTLAGVLLTAMAVSALCVCVGQSFAAEQTQRRLNEIFVTMVLPAVNYSEEADAWVLDYAAAHPEVVKNIGRPSLISAYIPALNPDNYTTHIIRTAYRNNNCLLSPHPGGEEYASAMVEITLTEIGTPLTRWLYAKNGGYEYVEAPQAGAYVQITGVIENVIGLADGYPDYMGFTLSGTVYMPSQKALDSLDLTVGERYLIYTTDLYDNDWFIRCSITMESPELGGKLFDAFDPDRLTVFESEANTDFAGQYQFDGFAYNLRPAELKNLWKITCQIEDQSAMPNWTWRLDFAGNPTAVVLDYQTYFGKDGELITVTPEAYHERYAGPTIVHLEGTAKEYLESANGALWADALYNIEINSHAFPLIGVDSLSDIADFARNKADIVDGRDFTQQELADGTKVCIISQSLAERNGLRVGDTLTVQVYENDPGIPYQINISQGDGSVNPVACYYFDNTMELYEAESYTIIGLYRQDVEWGNVDDNLYAFTPNTIFVPKTSVQAEVEYGYAGFFRSLILHSGSIEQFQQAAAQAGFSGVFYYHDSGYSAVADSLETYREGAGRALIVGICVYLIVMLLFFLLFPFRQRRVLATMESLGAQRVTQIIHILLHCGGILLPGSILGTAAGVLLWKNVVNALTQGTSGILEIEQDISAMAAISVVQLLAALTMSVLAGLIMTSGKNRMKRK